MTEQDAIRLYPIGVVRSRHTEPKATPIQPVFAADCDGRAEIEEAWVAGLRGIEGFSHLILLYHLHRARAPRAGQSEDLLVHPYMGDGQSDPVGVFATRYPHRPNRIGISIVRLIERRESVLHLAGVDILDGTPLLDVKPYVPRFDTQEGARGGWTEAVDDQTARVRGRRAYPAGEDGP